MRLVFVLLGLLALSRAVPLTTSGIYTLSILTPTNMLTHADSAVPTLTTATPSLGSDPAWSIVLDATGVSATIQNILTLDYIAASSPRFGAAVVMSSTPFGWLLMNFPHGSTNTNFCNGGDTLQCITIDDSGSFTLSFADISGDAHQIFTATPTPPPAGYYQIWNVASNTVFGNTVVPGPAFLAPFPATQRSELWFVSRISAASFALQTGTETGWLSVSSSNGTVGVFSRGISFQWNVGFARGLGQFLGASGGFLTTGKDGLVTTGFDIDETSTWVFIPVDLGAFAS